MDSWEKNESYTLGKKLAERRVVLGLSIADVANELQVSSKYVEAIEKDLYSAFSAKIYAVGFVKRFAIALQLPHEEIVRAFNTEWEVEVARKRVVYPTLGKKSVTPLLTPARIGIGLGGILFILFFSFFISRFAHFIRSPFLDIIEPADKTVIEEPVVSLRGKTEKESHLTVNGREIRIDESGNFNERLQLLSGVNILEFLVHNRFGKEQKVWRYIVVR